MKNNNKISPKEKEVKVVKKNNTTDKTLKLIKKYDKVFIKNNIFYNTLFAEVKEDTLNFYLINNYQFDKLPSKSHIKGSFNSGEMTKLISEVLYKNAPIKCIELITKKKKNQIKEEAITNFYKEDKEEIMDNLENILYDYFQEKGMNMIFENFFDKGLLEDLIFFLYREEYNGIAVIQGSEVFFDIKTINNINKDLYLFSPGFNLIKNDEENIRIYNTKFYTVIKKDLKK